MVPVSGSTPPQKLKPSGHNKISPDISAWMRIFPADLFLFCDEAIWFIRLIEKN